jgi:parvulin-like peptidyl-prolyl isomerase
MGKQITDEEYKNIVEDRLLNNKLSVKDYNESLDKEIQAYRDKI